MFIPKYTITNSTLRNIGAIDASKEIVESLSLIPAWETKLRREALIREIYYGARLEGNKLSMEDVSDIFDGRDVVAEKIDVQEVLNLSEGIKYINSLSGSDPKSFIFTIDQLLELHKILTSMLSENTGNLRTRQVIIRDVKTGEISYTPPVAAEIPYLMEDLINFLNEEGRTFHPILKAAITHFELYRIHPFVEGNNHIARLYSLFLLYLDRYSLNKYLSFEEYFEITHVDYYYNLQDVAKQDVLDTHERDLTPWLEYFTAGVGREFLEVKDRVKRISSESKVQDRLGEEMVLTERQIIIMEYLHRHKEMKNKDFRKIFPDYSDDTVLREIKFLKQKGLVKKVGNTKRAIYTLV